MSPHSNGLGGRLPPAECADLSEPKQQLFDRITHVVVPWAKRVGFASHTDDGRFIGPFNPALLSPVIGGQFLAFQAAEEENTSLAPSSGRSWSWPSAPYGARSTSCTPARQWPGRLVCLRVQLTGLRYAAHEAALFAASSIH